MRNAKSYQTAYLNSLGRSGVRDFLEMSTIQSTAVDSYCLECGQHTTPRNQRILCSEASSNVRTAWERLLDERLKQRDAEVDIVPLLGNEHSPNPGCMCKKCFMSVKAFSERKHQFLEKLDHIIERMPKIPSQGDHDEELHQDTPSRLQSKKRLLPIINEQHCTKRPVNRHLTVNLLEFR